MELHDEVQDVVEEISKLATSVGLLFVTIPDGTAIERSGLAEVLTTLENVVNNGPSPYTLELTARLSPRGNVATEVQHDPVIEEIPAEDAP